MSRARSGVLASSPSGPPRLSEAIQLEPRDDLFFDEALRSIQSRALAYLPAGVAVHFRGPAGTGKTTLAMEIAAAIGRPAVMLAGDGWFTAANLIGAQTGARTRQVRDNYIASVKKVEAESRAVWTDSVLTKAVKQGFTLIYDEFTRSPAEANNPLLSVLEERALILPGAEGSERYVKAHGEFRAIFTSNPDDYAAVSAPQDALLDRMITFDLSWHGEATEIGIVSQASGLEPEACAPIVRLVRAARAQSEGACPPSLRAAIMIAKVAKSQAIEPSAADGRYVQLCLDVLGSRRPRSGPDGYLEGLRGLILAHAAPDPAQPEAA